MAYTAVDANTSVVSGILTEQIMSLYDVLKPQMIPTLFARFGSQYMPQFMIFRALGREEPIAGDEWHGWEENWYHDVIITSTDTAAGSTAGATVDITLDPSLVDADGNYYPRVGNIVSLPGTYMQVRITAINDTSGVVITLKPLQSTDTIPAISAGTTLAISSIAFGAGTAQPKGTSVGSTYRSFVAQILKETIGAQGSQLVNEKWYKILSDGRNLAGYYTPGTMRGEYLLGLEGDGAITWGNETNNITETAADGSTVAVKTTKGLMRWATEGGFKLQYAAGSFTPTDLDEVGNYYLSQGITAGYSFGWLGNKFRNDIENGMVSYLKNTGVDYTSVVKNVFKGNQDLAVNMGVAVIKKGGITHILTTQHGWSHPKVFGAAGYDMPQRALFTPLSKFVDPQTKVTMDNIATRYRALGNYNRRFETWTVQGAGPGLKVTDIDSTNTYFRSHYGLQVFKANQFVYAVPA